VSLTHLGSIVDVGHSSQHTHSRRHGAATGSLHVHSLRCPRSVDQLPTFSLCRRQEGVEGQSRSSFQVFGIASSRPCAPKPRPLLFSFRRVNTHNTPTHTCSTNIKRVNNENKPGAHRPVFKTLIAWSPRAASLAYAAKVRLLYGHSRSLAKVTLKGSLQWR
jgi:hypothetical protein